MQDRARGGYRQYCGLAKALDHVGDRWTLLVIRELLLGPSRYSDIRANLPGIATNLLADRLRALERDGIVSRRALPPPAASVVYELTDEGKDLEPALLELIRWGGRWMGEPDAQDSFRPGWLVLALRALLPPTAPKGDDVACVLHVGDAVLGLRLEGGRFGVSAFPPEPADVVLEGEGPAVLGIASGRLRLDAAVRDGVVRAAGKGRPLRRLTQALGGGTGG